MTSDIILKGLLQILGLPNIVVEQSTVIVSALEYYRQDMDFADALHLASSITAEKFYTFDKHFVKAGKLAGMPLERLEKQPHN